MRQALSRWFPARTPFQVHLCRALLLGPNKEAGLRWRLDVRHHHWVAGHSLSFNTPEAEHRRKDDETSFQIVAPYPFAPAGRRWNLDAEIWVPNTGFGACAHFDLHIYLHEEEVLEETIPRLLIQARVHSDGRIEQLRGTHWSPVSQLFFQPRPIADLIRHPQYEYELDHGDESDRVIAIVLHSLAEHLGLTGP